MSDPSEKEINARTTDALDQLREMFGTKTHQEAIEEALKLAQASMNMPTPNRKQ